MKMVFEDWLVGFSELWNYALRNARLALRTLRTVPGKSTPHGTKRGGGGSVGGSGSYSSSALSLTAWDLKVQTITL